MVHFIQFNTETDFPNAPDEPGGEGDEYAGPFAPSGTQLAWLAKDLASVDRKKTPWVIAAGHRPWYVSQSECVECRAAFEPLLLQYGVDLVLHGHKHFYERESAIDHFVAQEITNNPTAPWYIVNGAVRIILFFCASSILLKHSSFMSCTPSTSERVSFSLILRDENLEEAFTDFPISQAGHYDGLDTPTLPLVNTSRKLIDTVYGWSLFTVHNCTHLTTEYIASGNNSVLDTATLYKQRTCDVTTD